MNSHNDSNEVPLQNFEVTIHTETINIQAPDYMEAATRFIEMYKNNHQEFQIGSIITVKNLDKNDTQYILSEVALANAGLYFYSKQISDLLKKKRKKD